MEVPMTEVGIYHCTHDFRALLGGSPYQPATTLLIPLPSSDLLAGDLFATILIKRTHATFQSLASGIGWVHRTWRAIDGAGVSIARAH
jgi:hypothetical protein